MGELESNKLYVGNLPYSSTRESLTTVFEQYGEITDVHIVMDRDSGRPRGFAFVTFGTEGEAEAAIKGLDKKEIDGREVTVNKAQSKSGGGGRGRGGYGRGGGGRGGYDRDSRY